MNLLTWISSHTAVVSAGATVVSAVSTLIIACAALAGVRIASRHRDVAEQTLWDSKFQEYEKTSRESLDPQNKISGIYKLIDLADKHPKIYYERVASLFSELLRENKLLGDDIKEKIMMWFSSRKGEQRKIERKLAKENRPAINIWNTDLSGLRLPSIDLSGMDLLGVKLAGADLSNANLIGVKLAGADLSNTKLIDVKLASSGLSNANLKGARLAGADLSNANLKGAKNLTKEQLDEAVWDPDEPPITDFSDSGLP